jgi:CHAT domain-containing protein
MDKKSESLLSVGNPSFDPGEYPDLKSLPESAREAEEIAAGYSIAYKLIGPNALKDSIEKKLPDANVFHFAGHYIVDERYPLLSRLVLAKKKGLASAEGDGDLKGGDLVGKRLPHAKLVVLSACQTGSEGYYNGEGLMGISRMFLETGIPLVVASQWAVESESTAQLMIKFHHYRKAPSVSSVEALRQAQLEMLNDRTGPYRDPYYWAPFLAVGGYADF